MKWHAKPEPKEGEHRTALRFAWLPTRCEERPGEHVWVWLETYHVRQRLSGMSDGGTHWLAWHTTRRLALRGRP